MENCKTKKNKPRLQTVNNALSKALKAAKLIKICTYMVYSYIYILNII